jgi:hypothetical protein
MSVARGEIYKILMTAHGAFGIHSWELRVAARCFDRPTVVDGRWVFTVDQARFENAQPALATLDEDVMVELGCAIGVGLQLY